MKRNLIFGLIAIVFAVGTAFATKTATVATFVWTQQVSGGTFTLQHITPEAAGSGSFDYQVTIAVSKSGIGSRTVFGRDASGVILKNTSSTIPTATVQVGGETITPVDVANSSAGN